jgi:hydroxymethylpyrimidine pyrophosphatase-like HAD family hydrolase
MAGSDLTTRPARAHGIAEPALVVTNLLNDLSALGPLLDEAAGGCMWLDAYLLAAGMTQIADDYLHDAPYPLDDASALLAKAGSRPARVAGRAVATSALMARRLSARHLGAEDALVWQRQVADLRDELADIVVTGHGDPTALALRCHRTVLAIRALPVALRRTVVRLPACFHHFDQRPDDLLLLAERFSRRGGVRGQPLLVVGVRTSGSYLAPLIAAALRRRGAASVRVLTIRPGRRLHAGERALVRDVANTGGQVLLTDDPPVTGASLLEAAAVLERLGVNRTAIVALLALQGTTLPPALSSYDGVFLRSPEWSVRAQLHPDVVGSELTRLLAGELHVDAVRQLPPPGTDNPRGHRRALFSVHGRDAVDGTPTDLTVLVSGTGVGYLGAHQLGVARTLGGLVPRVLGVRDGLLYQEWMPAERRITDERQLARAVAAYVAARRRRLRIERDPSTAMVGQRPVWEVAGLLLGAAFGRAAPLARVMLVDPAMRRLLHVAEPSVIDGSMTPDQWRADDDGRPLKFGFSDRTYWNLGLACCDATFDLAGVGAFASDGAITESVRRAWRRRTGENVDPERWLLYELAHLWGRRQADPAQESAVRHAYSRSVQRYFAEVFLADLERPAHGPLVALDIDGVLETDQLGFPTLTRASATALRALIAHGYRPVPVTGRGLEEVRDRCRSYGLAAGVAEYGSVVCLGREARAVALVDDDHAEALRRLRAVVLEREGVRLDPAYVHALRAYRCGAGGSRRPLSAAEAAECIRASAAGGMVQLIQGDGQSDFVAAGIDKGRGLSVLMEELGAATGRPAADDSCVALAVGDTASDAPMLALGAAAYVPAHAAPEATASGAARLRRAYQAGLSLAVAELLGHPPGDCARCRVAPQTSERQLLLDLFSIAEAGRRGLAVGALRFVARSRRAGRVR